MVIKNRRIFITGGTGFIGSYLVERLFKHNTVTCFDRRVRSSNIDYLLKRYGKQLEDNLHLVEGDVRNREDLRDAIANASPNLVFHLASIAGVRQVVERPFETMEVNVLGSHNLLVAMRESGSKLQKVVFASTSEVYGPTTFGADEDAFTTTGSPYDPRWSYSASKIFVEHMFIALRREVKLPVVVARPFNIYGPRQIGEGAVHTFLERALRGEPLVVHGKGDQIRAWCYIDDCVDGLLLVAEKGDGIYNIGSPQQALTTYMLAQKIKDITGGNSDIVMRDIKFTYVYVRVPSIRRIQDLGYKPRVTLDDGLKRTIEWYRNLGQNANPLG